MTVAALLVLYSIAVLVFSPPLLRSLTKRGHAPRLGVTAWLIAITSVLLSWVAAALFLLADVTRLCTHHSAVLMVCIDRLHDVAAGNAGVGPQLLVQGTAIGAGAVSLAIVVRLAGTTRRLRVRAREHADAVRLVGRRTSIEDVVVVPAQKPAAYCVSGRPPAIVVTSATLSALNDTQLAAVLAHERAHLSGRHGVIITALRSLATALPTLALMHQGAQHVPRLLEMCADDTATRHHDCADLLSGLIALCGAAPSEAMAASSIAVLARAERLAGPPSTLAARLTSAALSASIAILSAGPWIAANSACIVAVWCDM